MIEPQFEVPVESIEGQLFTTLIEGVTVVSPGKEAQTDASVEIRGDRIAWIGSQAEGRKRFANERIAARGAICMPGFVNTHNHTPLMIVRGMVEDLGFAPAYTPGIPQGHWLSEEETYLLARLGHLELLCAGCTTVVDYYRKPAALARAAHDSGVRAFIGGRIMDADTAELAQGRFLRVPALGEETFRDSQDLIARWHGADQGRIQCVHAPHAADTCSRPLLQDVANLAARDDLQVHTHLAQSRLEVRHVQEREGLGPVDLLHSLGLLNQRLFAAHCIFLEEADILLAGQAGINVCHAPIGNATFGALAPIESLRAAGANMTLCTDTKTADMFETMRMAIIAARIRAQGKFVLDARTMLDWATRQGATALGLQAGQIEVGCLADLVVMDPAAPNLAPVVDGFGILVHSGSAGNVQHVFCAGKALVRDGVPTLCDAKEVIREAQQVATRLWNKARQ